MGHTGGASPASLKYMINIPFIALNSGKMGPLRMFLCVIWAIFLSLVTQAQVVAVRRMTTCLEINA